MIILKERIPKVRVRWRTSPFAQAPAVVRTDDAVVNLFPGTLADIIDKEATCPGLKGKGIWITQSHCPNCSICASRRTGDSRKARWIIGRNAPVGIDPEKFS